MWALVRCPLQAPALSSSLLALALALAFLYALLLAAPLWRASSLARVMMFLSQSAHTHVRAGVEVLEGRLYAVGGKDEAGNKVRLSYAHTLLIVCLSRMLRIHMLMIHMLTSHMLIR